MFLFVNLTRLTVDKVDTQGAMVYTKVSTPSATARPTRIVVYIVNILQTLAYLQLAPVGWEDLYSQKGRSYIFESFFFICTSSGHFLGESTKKYISQTHTAFGIRCKAI